MTIRIVKVENNLKQNRITVYVDDISMLMDSWTGLRLYRGATEAMVTPAAVGTITLDKALPIYVFTDAVTGVATTSWYTVTPYTGSTEGTTSAAMQTGTKIDKIGYTFGNYTPPTGEWGKLLTADDMRYTFMWGTDCVASNIAASSFEDEQFDYFVNEALADFEKELTIDIRKKVYKTNPDSALVRAKYWRSGVDYTDEDDAYPHDPALWNNFGFLQLRHMPVISVERAIMYNPVRGQTIDLIDANWLRLTKTTGQLHMYPTGGAPYGPFVSGVLPWRMWGGRFPQGFEIDSTCGYSTAEFVPEDLRSIIGIFALIKCISAVGDGILGGFSSQSVGLDNLSESFSSTQSATSAYFGARLIELNNRVKLWLAKNRMKYGAIPMSFVGY
jgi:hypothetical protein